VPLTPAEPQPASTRFTAGSLYAFVVLGLPAGMLGVAWPVLRHDFRQPLASLGELLLASLLGYLTVTSGTGWALRRFGAAALLTASAAAAAIGTGVFAATRSWPVLVLVTVLTGAAGGGLDAGLNTAVALTGRTRLMNLIHAAFGVGAALGPLLVTAAVAVTYSWRGSFVVLLVLDVGLVGVWLALRNAFAGLPRRRPASSDPPASLDRPAPPSGTAASNSRPILLLSLSLTLFFCYAGIEIAVGSWSASFLRAGPLKLSPALAGLTVFGYWAGLTAGRVGAAALGSRLSPRNAVRAGTIGTVAGAAAIWANPAPAATVAALVVIGVSLGPIFPALVSLTPERVGPAATVNVVGWQLAASGAGGTGLSALTGVVLQQAGLASFGPTLTLLAAAMFGLNLIVDLPAGDQRKARKRRPLATRCASD
jgi:fucose permease